MPITIAPISRRRFLKFTALGAASMMISRLQADTIRACDPYRFALLSDTHISADPKAIDRECNMSERFATVVEQVLSASLLPSLAFVNGDCAHKIGEAADYQQFLKIAGGMAEKGVPVNCSLGNHDNREIFFKAAPENGKQGASSRLLDDRQLLLVKTPRVNWIVLDTLDATSKTPGRLGDKQLQTLKETLDLPEVNDKPVLIMMHHNPEPNFDPATTQPAKGVIGLLDTKLLYEIITPRQCVKAIFYGHTHKWEHKEQDGIHLINLPAIGYPFDKAQPTGWIDFYVEEKGAKAKLMTLDTTSKQNGEVLSLAWR